MVVLEDVAFCCVALERPILVTSIDPHASVHRILKILREWPISSQITAVPTENGASVFSLMDLTMENQRSLYREIRKHKYPLILISSTNFELDKKLETLLLFNYRDNVDEETASSSSSYNPFKSLTLSEIKEKIRSITITTEVKTYIYDLIVEVRYSRFIKGGLPTYILSDLTDFVRFKAYMLNMTYVTPAIVKRCFKIILPLRLHLIEKEDDPTYLYGSNPALVQQLINVLDVNDVIDIAISNVRPPI